MLAGENYSCDPELSELYTNDWGFKEPYHWISSQLNSLEEAPSGVTLPIWAWHTNYGQQRKPDRRKEMFNNYPKLDVIMELEVPDRIVLLSDFDDWHCVLNDFPIFSEEEQKQDEAGTWSAGYDEWDIPIYTEEFKHNSWQRVFNADGDFVQACFWQIKPEYLVKIHRLRKR